MAANTNRGENNNPLQVYALTASEWLGRVVAAEAAGEPKPDIERFLAGYPDLSYTTLRDACLGLEFERHCASKPRQTTELTMKTDAEVELPEE